MIYFTLFRENQFKQLTPFKSDEIRALLRNRLASGGERFRATATDHFKTLLERGEVGFDAAVPYLESLLEGESKRVANYHLYVILAKHAAAYPDITAGLIEKAVSGELKSIHARGKEIWHPKQFSKALRAVEQAGPRYAERIAKVRASMEPYKEKGQMYEISDL